MVSKPLDAERHGFFIMKEIPLSRGLFALVDDEDYDMLIKFNWHAQKCRDAFYAERKEWDASKKKMVRVAMHRLILGLTDKNIEGDHIDRNGLNNQKNNLRAVTGHQNSFNKGAHKNSSSKYKGVTCVGNGKWTARIMVNKVQYYLGRFIDEIEAAKRYDAEAVKVHGEFAYLNFPN